MWGWGGGREGGGGGGLWKTNVSEEISYLKFHDQPLQYNNFVNETIDINSNLFYTDFQSTVRILFFVACWTRHLTFGLKMH